jgi:hypothetical protein
MLKLVVSQTTNKTNSPVQSRDSGKSISNEPFSVLVTPKGPFLYSMTVQDPTHFLNCELIIEIEASKHNDSLNTVICHFPQILDEDLFNFVEEDEILLGIIMIQFQMKILTHLLNFCMTHYATNLIIYPDDTYNDYLGIYREFLSVDGHAYEKDAHAEVELPINQQIIDDWASFMDHINLKFRQSLWRDQRRNQAIKNYLKHHPF